MISKSRACIGVVPATFCALSSHDSPPTDALMSAAGTHTPSITVPAFHEFHSCG